MAWWTHFDGLELNVDMLRDLYKSFIDQNTLVLHGRHTTKTKTLNPTWADDGPNRICKLAPLYFDNALSNDRLPLKSRPVTMKRSPPWR